MKIYRDTNDLPRFRNPTVTLGTFDGVHLGHQEILKTLILKAREIDGETVLLTFWPHPRMVLHAEDQSLKLLNTIEEKIEILEKSGLGHLAIIPFTKELSEMTHLQFIQDVLVKKFQVKSLVVGHDHQFGKNREGNYEQLVTYAPIYHFELTQVPALEKNGVSISSSKIRQALEASEVDYANELLGYKYMVSGQVIEGKKRGRELGYPTANIKIDEYFKLVPGDGIYAVEAIIDKNTYKGMASIGYNPTFGDTGKTMEVNIFNFDQGIYNKNITIKFWHFLRKEVKFATLKDLVQQLRADEIGVREFFANH